MPLFIEKQEGKVNNINKVDRKRKRRGTQIPQKRKKNQKRRDIEGGLPAH